MAQNGHPKKGRSRAQFIIVAAIVVATLAFLALPVPFGGLPSAPVTTCLSNLKQLAVAENIYESDYDERMMPAHDWMDRLSPDIKSLDMYYCSEVHDPGSYGYGFNDRLAGLKATKIPFPERQIMFFDSSDLKRSAFGGPELLPDPGRHRPRDSKTPLDNVVFADTHSKSIDPWFVNF